MWLMIFGVLSLIVTIVAVWIENKRLQSSKRYRHVPGAKEIPIIGHWFMGRFNRNQGKYLDISFLTENFLFLNLKYFNIRRYNCGF